MRLRTWPGAVRSPHPEASVVAVGPRAAWLAEPHAGEGYGAGGPFARLVEAGGQVLLLGAPLATLTLLHHAEAVAAVAGKRMVTYRVLVAAGGGVAEREYTDIDTDGGAFPYERLQLGEDPFAAIARAAPAAEIGVDGRVGAAACRLFPAPELTAFATRWLEDRFG